MAPVTDSPTDNEKGLRLTWSGRLSLTSRILAVNIFAIALLAGSFFYLDGFRKRLVDERLAQAGVEIRLIAGAVARTPESQRSAVIAELARDTDARVRLIDQRGIVLTDSDAINGPAFRLRDPTAEPWQRQVALRMDRLIDWIVNADIPPHYDPATIGHPTGPARPSISFAPDRTHIVAASAEVGASGDSVTLLRNARDIRRLVRAERSRLGQVIGTAILLSVFLSLFLARTIVRPLQRLADAAVQVRLGHAREVEVPRLPFRGDEIGRLARALSDMTHALRKRIDATEAFAADVAHEIKNPLASLSSAVETLENVADPKLTARLHGIIREDVWRLDRLITDISDLSRIDAQIARTRFAPVDLGAMIDALLKLREERTPDPAVAIAFARPARKSTMVMGDERQLSRVIDNLLDNAVSFSAPGDIVRISATKDQDDVRVRVDDDGPGIPESAREAVFERFHSDRANEAEFGAHSGLGLSIARTIVEAHGGTIRALGRENGQVGARIEVRLAYATANPA